MFTNNKNNRKLQKLKKNISVIISISLIFNSLSAFSVIANAKVLNKQKHEEMKKELATLTYLLADVMEDKVENQMIKIKDEILKGGYDYDLTMEAMREGDPYAGVDYVSIIAAYMTGKQIYRENKKEKKEKNENFPGIMSLPMIECKWTVSSANVVKPVPIDTYEETKDGYFIKNEKNGKIYAVSQTKAYDYEEVEPGLYKRIGEKKIEPETENVKYLAVSFSPMDYKKVFEILGLDEDDKDVKEKYEDIKDTLLSEITTEELRQSMWVQAPPVSIPSLSEFYDDGEYEDISLIRKIVCLNAMSLQGMIPYEWGGKASHPGYDDTWWSFKKNGKQKGLDCSGFVQWDFMTSGFSPNVYGDMSSTHQMLKSPMKNIAYEDLKPGDIGVKIGTVYNHTGIYMGKKNGKDMWAHCSSAKNSVTIGEYNFHVFYDPYSPDSGRWDDALEEFSKEHEGIDWNDDNTFLELFRKCSKNPELWKKMTGEDFSVSDKVSDKISDDISDTSDSYDPTDDQMLKEIEPATTEEDLLDFSGFSDYSNISDASDPVMDNAENPNTSEKFDDSKKIENHADFNENPISYRTVKTFKLFKKNIWENFLEKYMDLSIDKLVTGYKMQNTVSTNFSNSDVHLLAQLIVHEAGSEGLNGWIGVAEVVRNRIISPRFPNTLSEVVYQNGQFTGSASLSRIKPSPDIENVALAVLEGRMTVLGNSEVLYFRNPSYAGLSAQDAVDWGSHGYFTSIGHHAFYTQGSTEGGAAGN